MKYVVILLIALIALSGCDFVKRNIPGIGSEEKVTEGSGLQFHVPPIPREVFVGQGLQIPIVLENTGKSTVENAYLSVGGHSVSIKFSSPTVFTNIYLEGRSEFVGGEQTTRVFQLGDIELPTDKQRTESLVFTACYQYTTQASPTVCINPKLIEQGDVETGCDFLDAQIEGDQGAPVVVSKVETFYDIPGREVEFRIFVTNVGGGQATSDETYAASCLKTGGTPGTKLGMRVFMSGQRIDCKGLGDTTDTFEIIKGGPSIICRGPLNPDALGFTTPLSIDLIYGYVVRGGTEPFIIKNPSFGR